MGRVTHTRLYSHQEEEVLRLGLPTGWTVERVFGRPEAFATFIRRWRTEAARFLIGLVTESPRGKAGLAWTLRR